MICIRVVSIESEVTEPKEDDDSEELVLEIDLIPELVKPEPTKPEEVPETLDTPERKAPLTAQELRALAAKPPETVRPKEKPLEPKPKPKPKDIIQIARTTDDQLTGEVPDTHLQGARDTIAASNASAVLGAPDVAAVKGIKPKDDRSETVDTTFNEGEFEHSELGGSPTKASIVPPSQITPPSETTVEEEVSKANQKKQDEIKSSVKPTDDVGEALEQPKIAETNKQAKKFQETLNKVAMNDPSPTSRNVGAREVSGEEEKRKTIANKNVDPNGLKQKAQEKKATQAKAQPKQQPKTAKNKRASDGAKNGFRSQAKATIMEGSISRRSNIASKNVKATPVGKYMSKISKLVETGWQTRMMQHADLVQPGTMVISFMVDERGKVKNINIMSQTAGSESQRSLTFQALLSAKIPPMPKEVIKSQGGDLLRFRYNFSFQ